MADKKKVTAKRDAEDAKANEAMRRKGGIDQVRSNSLTPSSRQSADHEYDGRAKSKRIWN